jgi:hypothetical protein
MTRFSSLPKRVLHQRAQPKFSRKNAKRKITNRKNKLSYKRSKVAIA